MKTSLEAAFQYARERMGASVKKQERVYKPKPGPVLNEGDQVWYHYAPNARKKLGKFWQGPHTIIKKSSDVTYRISGLRGKPPRVVHANDLKPVNTGRNLVEED